MTKKEQYIFLTSPPFTACQTETKMVTKTQTQGTGHKNNILNWKEIILSLNHKATPVIKELIA
jgi:hypothetical protein